MNFDEFIKKWGVIWLDADNEDVDYADIDLKLSVYDLHSDRRFKTRENMHRKHAKMELELDEVGIILEEESLQHPTIAMQESERKMDELLVDLTDLRNAVVNEWHTVYFPLHNMWL